MTKILRSNHIKKIKLIANKYDKRILSLLGFKDITSIGVQQSCPIHGGDNETAFSYDTNKHIWSCFTRHCEKDYGNDILGLICAIKNFHISQTLKWIEQNILDKPVSDFQVERQLELEDMFNFEQKFNISLDKVFLKALKPNHDYPLKRGFRKITCEFFQAGLYKTNNDNYISRYVMPIFNINNQLVGLTGRSIYEQCDICKVYHNNDTCPPKINRRYYSKWRHYPTHFHKSLELYNINHAKLSIEKTKTAILVEGPLDVWRLHEFGIYNAVALLGTNVSYGQNSLLLQAGCNNIILLMDNDTSGQQLMNNLKVMQRLFKVNNIKLPDGLDPGEMTKTQFEEYVAISI